MSALGRRLAKLGQVLRTVRHVKPRQALAQVEHMLVGLGAPRPWQGGKLGIAAVTPPVGFCDAPRHARLEPGRTLHLLNRSLDVREGFDWEFAGHGPLFAYHLHQHDYLRPGAVLGDEGSAARARAEIMLDWVARHPRGVGWDPHPISVRSFAWMRLLLMPPRVELSPDERVARRTPACVELSPDERATLLASWAQQLDCLDRNIEVRLQANHLLSNLMALVLGGLVIDAERSPDWLARWPWLEDELGRQVLADGAHEERSPMYHSLLLENVLDLLNVARVCPGRAPTSLHMKLEAVASRMLGALDVMTHPDGQIALLADSAFGIAPSPAELHTYARALGLEARPPERPGVLEGGGVVRLEAGPWCVIASVAGPSPAHQPGHAHCDALAIELSFETARVVCDTGVYEYVPGERREIARATRSHATLEIGGHEQAEVWAPHRVGGRPEVELVSADAPSSCEASCVGWATPRTKHTRRIEVDEGGVTIVDRVDSIGAVPVRMVWPLAPDVEARLDGSHATLRLPDGRRIAVQLPRDLDWRIEEAPFYGEFGREWPRAVMVGEGEASFEVRTLFTLEG